MNNKPVAGPRLGLKLVNLTPHVVKLLTTDGIEIVLTPEPIAARCTVDRHTQGTVHTTDGPVALATVDFGEVRDLPNPQPGTLYVVSRLVADMVPNRDDVAFPDDVIRSEWGRVITARVLARVVPGLATNGTCPSPLADTRSEEPRRTAVACPETMR